MRAARIICLLLAITMLLLGCYSTRRGEPLAGPMQLSDTRLQKGRQVFDTYCYKCHNEGEGGMAPVLNNKPLPKPLMGFQVRHGLGAMPAFDEQQINDEDLDTLLDYIVALRHHGQ